MKEMKSSSQNAEDEGSVLVNTKPTDVFIKLYYDFSAEKSKLKK